MGVLRGEPKASGLSMTKKKETRASKSSARRPPIPANLRAKVLRRADHRCQVPGCEFPKNVLDVHHINQDRMHNTVRNLIALCPSHHRLVHRGKIRVWQLRWYNRRSSFLRILKTLFPFAFREQKPNRPSEQIGEVVTGRRRWLTIGILLATSACCSGLTIVIWFWR